MIFIDHTDSKVARLEEDGLSNFGTKKLGICHSAVLVVSAVRALGGFRECFK